ncbi:MAG: PKD domain-containing protein [Planctomycetota bacterium]|jgi:hypothetical protein
MASSRPARGAAALLCFALAAGTAGCLPANGSAAGPRPFAVAMVRAGGRAGTELAVRPGTTVLLDGGESGTDTGGGELAWKWRQTAGPKTRVTRPGLARSEVLLARPGTYTFELVTSCGRHASRPSTVTVEVSAGGAVRPGQQPPPPPPDPPPPVRTANFALLDSNAAELIRIFGAKTGYTLRVEPGWRRPEELEKVPLTFMARKVSPPQALEMAARLIGGRYVRDRSDAAFLAAGLGWLRSERQSARFYPTTGLTPDGRGEELLNLTREACRGVLFACPGSSVAYERRHAGIQVSGPVSMHARVRALLAALSAEMKKLPPRPPASIDERHRARALGRKLDLVLVDREMSEVALELGAALGVPVAWEGPAADGRRPPARISVRGGGRTAAEVLAETAERAGCKGYSWVSGGGIWLYRTGPMALSAEGTWTAATVRAYPAGGLRAAGVLPGAAAHAVRKSVHPLTWRDPGTLCAYYRHTDRIVIVHTPAVQRQALRLMHDLIAKKK